jgi:hypothetical protein
MKKPSKRSAPPAVSDLSKDLTVQYLLSLRHHEEEVGLVLKGHLFIEYVLNQIIRKQLKSSSAILKDQRSYTFSVKLQMIYSTGYLPHYLFSNIRRINRLRNHLAHNLTLDLNQSQFRFTRSDGTEIVLKKRGKRPRYPARYYCKSLCFATLSQLRNHFALEFGEWPFHPDFQL